MTAPTETSAADIPSAGISSAGPLTDHVPVERRWGCGSMIASLRRVLVRTPSADGDFAAAGWASPNPATLLAEHAAFLDLLRGLGCLVDVADPAPGLVDACYTHDPVIMTPFGAIILRMRKPARQPEPELSRTTLRELDVPIIGSLTAAAHADGGDKIWLDERTLLIGRGHRTNAAAVEEIRALLEPRGVAIEVFDLPNYRGDVEVLHLMSVVSLVREDLAVVYPPLIPVRLLELLAERGIHTIAVDDEEFESQGGNVLAVAPGVAVLSAGNPRVRGALVAAGCEVHEFAGDTVAVAGTGGPTCLTLPLWREN